MAEYSKLWLGACFLSFKSLLFNDLSKYLELQTVKSALYSLISSCQQVILVLYILFHCTDFLLLLQTLLVWERGTCSSCDPTTPPSCLYLALVSVKYDLRRSRVVPTLKGSIIGNDSEIVVIYKKNYNKLHLTKLLLVSK